MEQYLEFVRPELMVVAVVLYIIGCGFKNSNILKDKYIPVALGGIGVLVCALYIFATGPCASVREALLAVFTSITQGILVAGLSTYINQILKQKGKVE